jgi:REP element-mobilizing transposase RayT
MKCWFGEVKSKVMSLNKLGKYVDQLWIEIPRLYPAVELDYYISMPCHIHGIIILNTLETKHASSLQRKAPSPGNIIGSFKSAATKWIRKNYYKSFSWQRRFYDHIIRNENDLYRIRNYIQNNPLKWEMDEYYKG